MSEPGVHLHYPSPMENLRLNCIPVGRQLQRTPPTKKFPETQSSACGNESTVRDEEKSQVVPQDVSVGVSDDSMCPSVKDERKSYRRISITSACAKMGSADPEALIQGMQGYQWTDTDLEFVCQTKRQKRVQQLQQELSVVEKTLQAETQRLELAVASRDQLLSDLSKTPSCDSFLTLCKSVLSRTRPSLQLDTLGDKALLSLLDLQDVQQVVREENAEIRRLERDVATAQELREEDEKATNLQKKIATLQTNVEALKVDLAELKTRLTEKKEASKSSRVPKIIHRNVQEISNDPKTPEEKDAEEINTSQASAVSLLPEKGREGTRKAKPLTKAQKEKILKETNPEKTGNDKPEGYKRGPKKKARKDELVEDKITPKKKARKDQPVEDKIAPKKNARKDEPVEDKIAPKKNARKDQPVEDKIAPKKNARKDQPVEDKIAPKKKARKDQPVEDKIAPKKNARKDQPVEDKIAPKKNARKDEPVEDKIAPKKKARKDQPVEDKIAPKKKARKDEPVEDKIAPKKTTAKKEPENGRMAPKKKAGKDIPEELERASNKAGDDELDKIPSTKKDEPEDDEMTPKNKTTCKDAPEEGQTAKKDKFPPKKSSKKTSAEKQTSPEENELSQENTPLETQPQKMPRKVKFSNFSEVHEKSHKGTGTAKAQKMTLLKESNENDFQFGDKAEGGKRVLKIKAPKKMTLRKKAEKELSSEGTSSLVEELEELALPQAPKKATRKVYMENPMATTETADKDLAEQSKKTKRTASKKNAKKELVADETEVKFPMETASEDLPSKINTLNVDKLQEKKRKGSRIAKPSALEKNESELKAPVSKRRAPKEIALKRKPGNDPSEKEDSSVAAMPPGSTRPVAKPPESLFENNPETARRSKRNAAKNPTLSKTIPEKTTRSRRK